MENVNFLNYKLLVTSVENLSNSLIRSAIDKTYLTLHFSAAHGFVEAEQQPELKQIFKSDILISDGFPLTKYLKFKNPKFEQVRGIDFMRETLYRSPKVISHFFLGSTIKNLEKIVEKAKIINPNISIAGTYSPNFSGSWFSDLPDWKKIIQESKADIVWIGMGAPKQFFIANILSTDHKFCTVSVGAAFDFFAETKSEAPLILRQLGLEWLFRLMSEPRRLFKRYLIGNIKFFKLIIKDFCHKT
jgi:N-acetylglucosaminyldiphosphoundecaprenol N-acetyl-beta-D-mannosaminyltransferase